MSKDSVDCGKFFSSVLLVIDQWFSHGFIWGILRPLISGMLENQIVLHLYLFGLSCIGSDNRVYMSVLDSLFIILTVMLCIQYESDCRVGLYVMTSSLILYSRNDFVLSFF